MRRPIVATVTVFFCALFAYAFFLSADKPLFQDLPLAEPQLDEPRTDVPWFTPDLANNALLPATSSNFIAWGDPNSDGFPDLWSGNHGRPPNLLINVRGKLQDATADWGIIRQGDAHGAAWADYNNDGRQDLIELVGGARGRGKGGENRLYYNEGERFTNVAKEAQIQLPSMRSRTPLWYDFNADNQLDLLLSAAAREGYEPAIFKQRNGVFERASDELGYKGVTGAKYAQIAYLKPGKPSLVMHSHNYPGRIFNIEKAHLSLAKNTMPKRLGSASGIISDTLWVDLNNDCIDDLIVVRDWRKSEINYNTDKKLEIFLVKPPSTKEAYVDFGGPEEIQISVYPRSKVWWHAGNVFLGNERLQEQNLVKSTEQSGLHFLANARTIPLETNVPGESGGHLQVSFEPAKNRWRLTIRGDQHEGANIVVTTDLPISNPVIGPEPRKHNIAPELFLSSKNGYKRIDLNIEDKSCSGIASGDFDNDTDQDLLLVCGSMLNNYADILLENDGTGQFILKNNNPFIQTKGAAEAAAVADYNRDGVLDMVISNGAGKSPFNQGPLQFYRGIDQGNNWLQVDLTPPVGTAYPFGSQLILSAGGITQARTVSGGIHGGAQDHQVIHFGLGKNPKIEYIELHWPDGKHKRLTNVEANQRITIPPDFYN